jgi:hypothetical protein
MARALAVLAACWLLCGRVAHADTIDRSVRQLQTGTEKVRLAAALSLAKSRDPRAVIAISGALESESATTIRRVAALALEKMVDANTAPDARALALAALGRAARSDRDAKVKDSAAKSLKKLSAQRTTRPITTPTTGGGDKPAVFVNIDPATDQSKKAPDGAPERVVKIVKRSIEKTGYATTWPGGLPTSAELTSNRSRAYIVASTVKNIEITKQGRSATIACTVAIRVAPWTGKDGGEKWEANKAASASGSAKAQTGTSQRDVTMGVHDCLEAVAEDVTKRQVVPFIKRLAQAP